MICYASEQGDRIIEKLKSYGLDEELALMPSSLYYITLDQKWFRDPTELTDRRWNNIKDDVVTYMRQAQMLRFAVNRAFSVYPFVKIVASMYDIFLQDAVWPLSDLPPPGIADLCQMPEFLELFERFGPADNLVVMSIEQMSQAKHGLFGQLPGLCTRWQEA